MDMILKQATVEGQAPTEGDMALINKQTLRPMEAGEVFTFRLAAANNEVDREYERFTEDTLAELAKLYVGKPVLTDHEWKAGNQVARVYGAEVEQAGAQARLILRCYMPRTEASAPIIAAIESGVMKECSVGCAVRRAVCSVCGADRTAKYCGHVPGKAYGGQTCHIDLEGAADSYEVSLCAVPCQPKAGVIKRWAPPEGAEPPHESEAGEDEEIRKALAVIELEEKRFC